MNQQKFINLLGSLQRHIDNRLSKRDVQNDQLADQLSNRVVSAVKSTTELAEDKISRINVVPDKPRDVYMIKPGHLNSINIQFPKREPFVIPLDVKSATPAGGFGLPLLAGLPFLPGGSLPTSGPGDTQQPLIRPPAPSSRPSPKQKQTRPVIVDIKKTTVQEEKQKTKPVQQEREKTQRRTTQPEPKKKPIEEPKKLPVEKPKKKPVEEPKKVPVEEPKKKPVEEPKKVPVEEPKKKPIEEPKKLPVEKPKKKPVEEPKKTPGPKADPPKPIEIKKFPDGPKIIEVKTSDVPDIAGPRVSPKKPASIPGLEDFIRDKPSRIPSTWDARTSPELNTFMRKTSDQSISTHNRLSKPGAPKKLKPLKLTQPPKMVMFNAVTGAGVELYFFTLNWLVTAIEHKQIHSEQKKQIRLSHEYQIYFLETLTNKPIMLSQIERQMAELTGANKPGTIKQSTEQMYSAAREQVIAREHHARFDEYYDKIFMPVAGKNYMLELMTDPFRNFQQNAALETLIAQHPDVWYKVHEYWVAAEALPGAEKPWTPDKKPVDTIDDAEFHFQQQVIPMLEQLGDRDFITDTEQAVKNRRARRIKSGMRVDIDATGEVLVPDTDNKDLPTIREYNRNKQSMSDLQAATHQSVLDQIEMIAATTSTSVNNTQYNTTKSPESTFDSYDQYDMPNVDVA